jgi:pyruvate,water dikinase
VIGGVAWSADPQTGRRDLVRIASNGAHVLVELGIGRARVALRSGAIGLTAQQCQAMAWLVVRAAWSVGDGEDPQQVEWQFDGGRFHFGQPRAIEELPRVTVPPALGQPVLWTNANVKDAIAGVPTTASWSFIQPYLRAILFAPIERVGYAVPRGMEVVRRFEGRAYLDLSSLQAAYFDAFGAPTSRVNRSLGGPDVEISLPPPSGAQTRRWRTAEVRLTWLMLRHERIYSRAIDRTQRAARSLPLDVRGYSDEQLIEMAVWIAERQSAFGPLFQIGNFAAGMWVVPLEQFLEQWLPGKSERVAAGLMAGSGQVTSAEHGVRLVELARVAAREPEAIAVLERSDAEPTAWRTLPATSAFRRELARFLDDFGHRGVYEAELANPRWIEDPRFLLDQVRSYLEEGVPAARAGEQRRAAEEALRQLPVVQRVTASWLARRARRSAALREAGKSALMAMALPTRMIMLEFARRLVDADVIDQVDDVFHLSQADLLTFARGDWDGSDFRALVAARRALREARLTGPAPPDLIGGTAPTVVGGLRGLAAAPGVGCGPARLIRHPSEGGRLRRGDVLVAPSTDPGWTPLFFRCAAVVTEAGGFLSHGAIVARELGLPAVVNVSGVLGQLTDGEMVCVDGNRGLVERQTVR